VNGAGAGEPAAQIENPTVPPSDHDPIGLNRIMISSLCLSMIFFGKPVPTFPDHAQLSSLILASRMTGPHLSISDFRNAASSAGVEPFGLAPSSSNRDLTAG
jgi:hypothetical protein